MTNTYFTELMSELACRTEGNFAFGVAQASEATACFPFSVRHQKGEEGSGMLFRFVAQGSIKPCLAALKEKRLSYTRWEREADARPGAEVLTALFEPPSDFYAKAGAKTLLLATANALAEAGLAAPETCPLCDRGDCDQLAYLENGYRATHATCLAHRLDLPEEDAETPPEVRGHYLTGFLGALLGALIAALPNWAQALSKSQVTPVLYAFLPIFSALLYRLFRGKARLAVAGVAVLLSSFLTAFALELVYYWIIVTNQAGVTIAFSATTALYFQSHSFLSTLQEMLWRLFFTVVGFFPAAVLLRRYAATGNIPGKMVYGAHFVRNSAMPKEICPPTAIGNAPAAAPTKEAGEMTHHSQHRHKEERSHGS